MADGLNLIFAGTPAFAATALQALIDSPHRIAAVYTQPDRAAGRGRKSQAGPVKQLALDCGLQIEQPQSLRDETVLRRLRETTPDVMVVAAYGLLLPEAVLSIPVHGCLNIHASLLPRWRGAAPIQRAILAGDQQTGITIMQMDKGLDTGPMLLKRACDIGPDNTAGQLHDRLAALGAEAIVEALNQLQNGELHAEAQQDALATYAAKITKEEARIDWHKSAEQIAREVRAFNPWPVSFTMLDDKTVRIWQADAVHTTSGAGPGSIGEVTKDGVYVGCGEGQLLIRQAQLPGARTMAMADVINGHPLLFKSGQRFE
jgi:methionyl-tRNA formyltransferase